MFEEWHEAFRIEVMWVRIEFFVAEHLPIYFLDVSTIKTSKMCDGTYHILGMIADLAGIVMPLYVSSSRDW